MKDSPFEKDSSSDIEDPKDLHPEVKPGSRFNKVWIIPIIALVLGTWLVKRTIDERGDLITVRFDSAAGLTVDKTEIKCRNVNVGKVEEIRLTDGLEVEVRIRIKPEHRHLIKEDSRFWVVKARVQGASISGLGTLISGAYIQLDPGIGETGGEYFEGLETPPLTPRSVEGLRLTLTAKQPGSVGIGSGIYYNDSQIGSVESREFDLTTRTVKFGVFIEQKYRSLVTGNSLFWQTSGVSLHIGTDGFDLDLPSLDSLVAGRIAVGVPEGIPMGSEIPDDSELELFKSMAAAETSTLRGGVEFLLLLNESLRGLKEGSPVEFRGLRVGRVGKISYNLVEDVDIEAIPVLVQLDTRLLNTHFPPSILDEGEKGFEIALQRGLRASIKSGNLLTGQMYVDLDYYPEATFSGIQQRGDRIVLPTVHTGLERIEDKIAALLDKFNELKVEELITKAGQTSDEATTALSNINQAMVSNSGVVADAQTTLRELTETVKSLKILLDDDDTKSLTGDLRKTLAQVNESLKPLSNNGSVYGDLRRTLDELRSTIRSIERMTTEIADKPNSLLFGKDPNSKKIPRARRK